MKIELPRYQIGKIKQNLPPSQMLWFELSPLQNSYVEVLNARTTNVTLFVNRVIVDITNLMKMTSDWIRVTLSAI